jgi:hypothetical protein
MVVDCFEIHMQAAHLDADAAQAPGPGVDKHKIASQKALARP